MNRKKIAAITALALTLALGGSIVAAAPADSTGFMRITNLAGTDSTPSEKPDTADRPARGGFGFSKNFGFPSDSDTKAEFDFSSGPGMRTRFRFPSGSGMSFDFSSGPGMSFDFSSGPGMRAGFSFPSGSGINAEFDFPKHMTEIFDSMKEGLAEKGIETEGLTNREIFEKAAENGLMPKLPELPDGEREIRKFSAADLAAELGIDTEGMTDAQIMEAVKEACVEKLKAALTEKGIDVDGLTERELMRKAIENDVEMSGFKFKMGGDGNPNDMKPGRRLDKSADGTENGTL